MGQLERYGLYVLCLVIVLILGVAIWGGDPGAAEEHAKTQLSTTTTDGGARGASVDAATPAPDAGDDFFLPASHEPDELSGVAAVQPPAADPKGAGETGVGNDKTEPAPAPATGLRTYVVRRGDSFERIALNVLKSRGYVGDIKRLNPDIDERRMRVGTVLKLPSVEAEAASAKSAGGAAAKDAVASGWREYVVKHGDNPWIISKAMYGSAEHAKEIMSANNIDDPRKLREKTVLRIPPRN